MLGIYIYTSLGYVFSDFTSKKTRRFVYILSCILMIMLIGFRNYNTGDDTPNYFREFFLIRSNNFSYSLNHRWELGFVLLTKVIGYITDDGFMYLFLISVMMLVPIFLFIYKKSCDPLMSLIVFMAIGCYASTMVIMRQMLALSILYMSLRYVEEKRFIQFALMVIIGALFHRTAVAFLPVYFIVNSNIRIQGWRKNRNFIPIYMLASLIIYFFNDRIRVFLNLFARFPENGNFNGGVSMFIVLWACVLLSRLLASKDIQESNSNVMLTLLLIGATIQPISFAFSNFARVVSYFSFSLIFLIPILIKSIKRRLGADFNINVLVDVGSIFVLSIWFSLQVVNFVYEFNPYIKEIIR